MHLKYSYWINAVQISSPIQQIIFSHFDDSFLHYMEAFQWCDHIYLVLLLLPLPLESDLEKHCQANVNEVIPFVYLQQLYSFESYIQDFNTFRINLQVWYNVIYVCSIMYGIIQFHSFPCTCPVFPVLFIKKTILSTLYDLCYFVMN